MRQLKHNVAVLLAVCVGLALLSAFLPTPRFASMFYVVASVAAFGILFDVAWWRVAGAMAIGVAVVFVLPKVVNPVMSDDTQALLTAAMLFGASLMYPFARWWTHRHPGPVPPVPPAK